MSSATRSRLKALLEASARLDQQAIDPTAIERELLPNAMLVPPLARRIGTRDDDASALFRKSQVASRKSC